MRSFLTLLALACLLPAQAAAPAHTTADEKERQWQELTVRALQTRADANSLATAAALQTFTQRPAAVQLSARASEAAPQNAAIGWLHLQLCAMTTDCATRDAATVLRWVDPDNSAVWLSTLSAAQKDGDSTEVDRVLADMAQGTRFDIYFTPLTVMLFDALAAVRREAPGDPVNSDGRTLDTVIGLLAAQIIPSFQPLIQACRQPGAGTERREDCLKIGTIMQTGDSVIVQLIGLNLEKRLVPEGGREAKAVSERRRVLDWQMASAGKLERSVLPWTKNARARERLHLMRAKPREEDVVIALLRRHSLALEPPESHR